MPLWGGEKKSPSYPDGTVILPFICQKEQEGHTWNQFVIRVSGREKRDQLRQKFGANGIQTEIYYPRSMHEQNCFISGHLGSFPSAEALARESLALPLQLTGTHFPDAE